MTRRGAERRVAAGFLVSTAAAVGFVAAYVLDAGTQALGVLLATACGALGVGLVLWSKQLLPGGTYVEKREPMAPPRDTQTAFLDTLDRGGAQTGGLLRRTLILSALGLGAAAIVPLRGLLLPTSPPPGRALRETPWRAGRRLITREGTVVRAADVEVGTALTVFPEGLPESDDGSATLVRLDPRELRRPGATSAAGAVEGFVAFSKLCTHAGCPVGLYEQMSHQLFCPCHQSVFDVVEGARPLAGPAARPLPQLPLTVDAEGYLAATGDFVGQVGPTFWRPA